MLIKQEFVIEHDVIPLPLNGRIVVCRRSAQIDDSASIMIVRKFKTTCGNVLEFHITRKNGFIRTIKPLYDCQPNCSGCADRIEKVRKLIASESKHH